MLRKSLFLDDEGEGGGGINGNSVTIEDMETQLAAADKPVEEPKVDPATQPSAWEQALRISEEARARAEAQLRSTPVAQPQRQVEVDPIEVLTDEQLQRIIDEKGTAAGLRAIQAQTMRLGDRHFSQRLEGMQSAGVVAAEASAASKYALEFELFGDEIRKLAADAPDKTALANANNWDSIIAYVRGKDGNIQKYVEKMANDASKHNESAARDKQRASAGSHMASTAGPMITNDADANYGLDSTERDIADKLGRSYKDYAKWKKVG